MIFFGGEYSGDKQALIAGSYILTPERTGFIRTDMLVRAVQLKMSIILIRKIRKYVEECCSGRADSSCTFSQIDIWPRRFWLHFLIGWPRNGAGRLSLICDPRWWQDLAGKASG